jgi:polyisoprenoid-binding protein YceI
MRLRTTCLWILGFAFLYSGLPAAAQNRVFTADAGHSRVEFTLGDVLHTVHGTFRLKSGDMHFNVSTGVAEGQLVVDAGSGDSGSRARDNKMKKDILETQKYPEIVFTPQQVKGTIAAQGTSEVELDGIMSLHGQPHAMAIAVPLTMNGNSASADISFDVPYVKWGLKNPSTLFLRVNDKVQIKIHIVGILQPQ